MGRKTLMSFLTEQESNPTIHYLVDEKLIENGTWRDAIYAASDIRGNGLGRPYTEDEKIVKTWMGEKMSEYENNPEDREDRLRIDLFVLEDDGKTRSDALDLDEPISNRFDRIFQERQYKLDDDGPEETYQGATFLFAPYGGAGHSE